ncbi:Mandelate racemase-like protein 1 [Sarcoptes scabiei]|uniref:Mandelate racemase-like protein 1 n=1 Tax=Sarcoptes scabiei TaxID=52283 RepID=A0A132AIJ5_SARSC|nr:Mandelate racemase-like protein 1 [Sarcoptes scabiei]
MCRQAIDDGFRRFKVKVGTGIETDRKRLQVVREEIGPDCLLMVDANQRWEVQEAIDDMKQLVDFGILWIEEPTSPDDILGHRQIATELRPSGIKVATGEQCSNRIMFKQFLAHGSMDFCQIDSCRLASINEILPIILMAAKFQIPICPHAGGVGLCEYVQHLAIWDFIAVSGPNPNRMIEYNSHLTEHFLKPARCWNGSYQVPKESGYCCEFKSESIEKFSFPNGSYWRKHRE